VFFWPTLYYTTALFHCLAINYLSQVIKSREQTVDGSCGHDAAGHNIDKQLSIVHQQTTSWQHVAVLRPNSADDETLTAARNTVTLVNLKKTHKKFGEAES